MTRRQLLLRMAGAMLPLGGAAWSARADVPPAPFIFWVERFYRATGGKAQARRPRHAGEPTGRRADAGLALTRLSDSRDANPLRRRTRQAPRSRHAGRPDPRLCLRLERTPGPRDRTHLRPCGALVAKPRHARPRMRDTHHQRQCARAHLARRILRRNLHLANRRHRLRRWGGGDVAGEVGAGGGLAKPHWQIAAPVFNSNKTMSDQYSLALE